MTDDRGGTAAIDVGSQDTPAAMAPGDPADTGTSGGEGSARHAVSLAAACSPAALYLLFVWHYSLNAPFSDDWSMAPLVSAAFHGHLGLSDLWTQYSEARLVVSKLTFVAFGYVDHVNLRSVVVFSGLVFTATFFLVLRLFRAYLGRPLTFFPVLCLGVAWFSVVDEANSLWAFQVAWYLTLLFLAAMIYFLFIWPRNRTLALALAAAAAIGGSLSMIQGLLLWPVGLCCLLWIWRSGDRRYREVVLWLFVAAGTATLYLHSYQFGVGCPPNGTPCTLSGAAHHPATFARFFLTLVGNIVPATGSGHLIRTQLLGAALCIAALLVIVGSIRERRDDARVPLPLLLVVFALLFDGMVTVGRTPNGIVEALQSRFTMPGLLLLVGILAFAWRQVLTGRLRPSQPRLRRYCAIVGTVALALLLTTQGYYGTRYGIDGARVQRSLQVYDARVAVNLDRIPRFERGCIVSIFVWNYAFSPPVALEFFSYLRHSARVDHLMVFEGGAFRRYRALGAPKVHDPCRVYSGGASSLAKQR